MVEILLPICIDLGNCQNFLGPSIAIQCQIRRRREFFSGFIDHVMRECRPWVHHSHKRDTPWTPRRIITMIVFGRLFDTFISIRSNFFVVNSFPFTLRCLSV